MEPTLYTDIKHTQESGNARLDMLQAQFKVLSDASFGARDNELPSITTAMIELDKYLRALEDTPHEKEDDIIQADKRRIEVGKAVKSFMQKEREELTGTLSEEEFIKIVDRLYDLAHNPTVKNAKARLFPDIKLSMYRFE